mmetsp:Transcript_1624/g.4985  ORF Transcript_1624/g.4985 Transcript_1624/m.4985 type:complete len:201 (+) Transcript_1624:466-1068(+)
MPSSPSTKTLASTMSARGATALNSSTSAISCTPKSRLLRLVRSSSEGSSSRAGRPADLRGPLRQSFRLSAAKWGTCSSGPAPAALRSLGSSACTTHRWSSSAASRGSPRPSLAARSAMARETRRQRPRSSSKSAESEAPSSSLRRCACARKRSSAFWGPRGPELPFLAALGPEVPESSLASAARASSSPGLGSQAALSPA